MLGRLSRSCDMTFRHCHICLRALQLLTQSAHSVRVAGYLPISRRCPTQDATYDVKLVCYLSFCGCGVGASVSGGLLEHAIRADFSSATHPACPNLFGAIVESCGAVRSCLFQLVHRHTCGVRNVINSELRTRNLSLNTYQYYILLKTGYFIIKTGYFIIF